MQSIFDYLPEIDADTAEEMAKQAGMDFDAIKVDTYYKIEEPTPKQEVVSPPPVSPNVTAADLLRGVNLSGNLNTSQVTGPPKTKEVYVPDKVAVIRDDDHRYLGTVGRGRGIVQYRDVLAFTEELVDSGDASYVTAGVTGNGEQAFLVMKAKKTVMMSGGDEVECYFYVTTSHDSSRGLEVVFSPLRKTNGTVLTFKDENRIRFRHSKRVEDRVRRAKLSLAKVNRYFDEMEESFRLLRSVRLSRAQFNLFIESLFPDPEKKPQRAEHIRAEIETIYNNGPAQQLPSTKNTMLGAYFAVVEYLDKISPTKVSKVRPNEYDAKLHRLLEGSGAQQKAEAYAFALDMARQLQNVTFAGSDGSNDFATEEK